MRIVKKPEIRRQEILNGALTVFSEKGYEKTTIADISAALKISQGLCYRYFTSKEEIYDAVIDNYAALITEKNLQNRPHDQSITQWVDEIPALLAAMKQAEREDQGLYTLLHSPQNGKMHRELCLKVGEKLLPFVTQVLEQAKRAGEIEISDCSHTAAFGLYGEIGLLLTEGTEAAAAIQKNWQMLLGLK